VIDFCLCDFNCYTPWLCFRDFTESKDLEVMM